MSELYRCHADNAAGDVVLHAKDVLELGVDANLIAGAANAATEQVARIELTPDLGRRAISTLELKARRFGDDEEVREAAEHGDDVLGDPVAKVILLGIARQVLERQHCHRWSPREASGRSQACDLDRL